MKINATSVSKMDDLSNVSQKGTHQKLSKVSIPLAKDFGQSKPMNDLKSPSSTPIKSGAGKGPSKEAKSGHQPKMKTPSSSAAKDQRFNNIGLPEKGISNGRKIEFVSAKADVNSVQEHTQHPYANSTAGTSGDVVAAMAVENW
ncbi:unnamed protein product [Linum trigynum]|uniref:Uncharacterized protein n=1 Tax=Linum trigynum TaxID=586398 RepID=A0AAV2FX53_9ROSI